jgi:cinnamyl-alcohol dehydrogenase
MKYLQIIEPEKNLGMVGLGGLGHMAMKLGKAFGLQVTVNSASPKKEKEAKEVLGVDHFIINKYQRQMEDVAKSLDYILDTIFVEHPLQPFISFLKVQRKLVLVGLPENPIYFHPTVVIAGRRFVGGSSIGGVKKLKICWNFVQSITSLT